MDKQEAILKLWGLAEECIKNGISIDYDSPYEKVSPSFGLGGFSKSGMDIFKKKMSKNTKYHE